MTLIRLARQSLLPFLCIAVVQTAGCISSNDGTVTLPEGQPPVATIIQPSGPVTIALGGTVNFRGNCVDPEHSPVLYGWDFGDTSGIPQTMEQSPSVVFAVAGTFTVQFGCTDEQNITTPEAADAIQSGSVAEVTVTVLDDLAGGDLTASTDEDLAVSSTLPGYGTDGLEAVYYIAEQPHYGSVVITNTLTGDFTYTPDPDYSGPPVIPGTGTCLDDLSFAGQDCFRFYRSDGIRATVDGTVTVNINPLNDDPVASNLLVSVQEHTGANLANTVSGLLPATDVDGDPLTWLLDAPPVTGSAVIDDDTTGAFTYTTDPDGPGTFTFTFHVNDGAADSNSATVTVVVGPLNDAPVTTPVVTSVDEDLQVTDFLTGSDPDGPAVVYSVAVPPISGRITALNAVTGQFTYKPNLNVNGADQFSFRRSDGLLQSNVSTVDITINAVNDAPVAGADTAAATEDVVPLTIAGASLTANDSDVDTGDTLTVVCPGGDCTGYVSTQGVPLNVTAGDITYDHTGMFQSLRAGQTLTDTLTYTVQDSGTATATAVVTVTVTGVNDDPAGVDDPVNYTDGSGILSISNGTLLGNDTDPDTGDTKAIVTVDATSVAGATVGLSGTSVTYNPGTLFRYLYQGDTAADSFQYTFQDGSGATSTATVNVTVTGINDAPSAASDTASAAEESPTVILAADLLLNDTDPDTVATADTPEVFSTPARSAKGAVLTVNPSTGDVTYAPGQRFRSLRTGQSTTDTFTYQIRDDFSLTSQATVTVTVNGENDAPTAINDSASAVENGAVVFIAVLNNDIEPDTGDTRSLVVVNNSVAGAAVTISGNQARYDHAGLFESLRAGQTTTDTFTYTMEDGSGAQSSATVTVTVTGANDAPVANNDSGYIVMEGGPAVQMDVLTNDTDVDAGDSRSIQSADLFSAQGLPVTVVGGQIVVTIGSLFNNLQDGATVADTLNYVLRDTAGATSTAQASFTITGTNDVPVAQPDTASMTASDPSVNILVLTNDSDPDSSPLADTFTVVGVTSPAQRGGTVTFVPGSVDYFPAGNFDYLRAGQISTDSFFYTIQDTGGLQGSAKVVVTVTGVNDAPTANDDNVSATENGAQVLIHALANDTDPDLGDQLVITSVPGTSVNGMTLTLSSNRILYDPNSAAAFETLAPGQTGNDQFAYSIEDPQGSGASATVYVTIDGRNDLPVPQDDFALAFEDDPVAVNIDVVVNDLDVDNGDSVTLYSIPARSQQGALLTLNAGTVDYEIENRFQYLPDQGLGFDQFNYVVEDSFGGRSIGTAYVDVEGVNDTPEALADRAVCNDGGGTDIFVLANDRDVDEGDTLSVWNVPAFSDGGAAVANAGSHVVYTTGTAFQYLRSGESTLDTFIYDMQDALGLTGSALVEVEVRGVNDAPSAIPDTGNAYEDGAPVLFSVLANDTDPDSGDQLRVISVGTSTLGARVRIVNGQVEYYTGTLFQDLPLGGTAVDTFTYTVSDVDGATSTAMVTVTVHGTNDTPSSGADTAVAYEDGGPVMIDALANDSDADVPTAFLLTSVTAVSPLGAALSIVTNQIRYDPGNIHQELAAGEILTDTFSYTMTDSLGGSATGLVTVNFTGTNDDPVPGPDTGTILEDGDPVSVGVLDNDTDVDQSDTLFLQTVSPASFAGAEVTFAGDEAIYDVGGLFQSLGVGQAATDTFTYTVEDSSGGTAVQTVVMIVAGTNDAPSASTDTGAAAEDGGPVLVDVLGNDTDIDTADTLLVVSVPGRSAEQAALQVVANRVSYDPQTLFQNLPAGATITDTFTYVMSDLRGLQSSSTVTMTVTGTNDNPVAEPDSMSAFEDGGPVTADLVANDRDVDTGDTRSLTSVSSPSFLGSVVSVNVNGLAVYDPGTGFQQLAQGQTVLDQFTYVVTDSQTGSSTGTVTVQVTGVNDAPLAYDDTATAVEDGGPVRVFVLTNDLDSDNFSTVLLDSVDVISANGAEVVTDGNDIYYDPGSLFQVLGTGETFTDTFQYSVVDELGASATATVSVTITGANDVPVAAADTGDAAEDGGPVVIDVVTNDSDVDYTDALAVSVLPSASSRGAALSKTGPDIRYDPGAGFQYLSEGAQIDDTFYYTLSDGHGGTSQGLVSVTVAGVNDAPVGVDDTLALADGSGPQLVDVLANDQDPDQGDSKSLVIVPANSTLGAVLTVVGNFIQYDPGTIFDGLSSGEVRSDTFTYTMSDGQGVQSSATVFVSVTGGNAAPVAGDDVIAGGQAAILEDGPSVALDVLVNDYDPDTGDFLTLVSVSDVFSGASVEIGAGQLVYSIGSLFQELGDGITGVDSFIYTIRDSSGVTASATVQVEITGVNDEAVANADIVDIVETVNGIVPHASFLQNDTDVDVTDVLAIDAGSTDATTGTLGLPVVVTGTDIEIDASTVDFVSLGDVFEDTFTVGITDGFVIRTAPVTVRINGTNDDPVGAAPVSFSCREGDDVDQDLSGTVSDPDTSDVLTFTETSGCAGFSLSADGQLTGTCPAMGISCDLGFEASDGIAAPVALLQTISYNTRYVTDTGAGDESGDSWGNAANGNNNGINDAISDFSFDGIFTGNVWVAGGTYDGGGSGVAFTASSYGVHVYGGFDGTETALSQRPDPALNPSVIDGEGNQGPVAGVQNSEVVLDGLEITDGWTPFSGGGLYVFDCENVVLRNLNIHDNYADEYGGGIYADEIENIEISNIVIDSNTANIESGGGIYVDEVENLEISNTVIDSNTANDESGGGIYIEDSEDVVIRNVTVSNNYADEYGGGLYIEDSEDITVRNSAFSQNTADDEYGGGIYIEDSEDILVEKTVLEDNFAEEDGGGIAVYFVDGFTADQLVADRNYSDSYGGAIALEETEGVRLNRVYATANQASSGAGGLSLYIVNVFSDEPMLVTDSAFSDNYTTSGGAGADIEDAWVHFTGVSFADNRADEDGGALRLLFTTARVVQGSFDGNVADETGFGGYSGGAVYTEDSSFEVANSAFWGNSVLTMAPFPAFLPSEIASGGNSLITAEFNCAQSALGPNTVVLDGSTDALSDPFVRGPFGKLALKQAVDGGTVTSACVDAGDPGYAAAAFLEAGLTEADFSSSLYGAAVSHPADAGAMHSRPDIYYVSGLNGDDSNDGSSWAAAKASLQAAVDLADWGDQVWVDTSAEQAGDTSGADPVVSLARGVMVIGGFDGAEEAVADRPSGSRTTLNGDRDGSLSATVGDADPVALMASDSWLEGVDIRWGYANGGDGGCVDGSDVFRWVLKDSTVEECYADGEGGGVRATVPNFYTLSYAAVLEDVTVSSSMALAGGGMASSGGRISLTGVTLEGNTAVSGGGLFLDTVDGPATLTVSRIADTEFVNNSALSGNGGGASLRDVSEVYLDSVTFTGNQAAVNGGGLGVEYLFNMTNIVGIDVTFDGNQAVQSGGGLYSTGSDSNIYMAQATFRNNVADSDDDGTGDGGAMFGDNSGSLSFGNSAFYGNLDGDGVNPSVVSEFASAGAPVWELDYLCSETDVTAVDPAGDFPVWLDGSTDELGDPFVEDYDGKIFLKHAGAGDSYTSACVDGGGLTLANWIAPYFLLERINLFLLTFDADYTATLLGDEDLLFGDLDSARHYPTPDVIHVTKGGAGTGDGSSWDNAANGLQAGIDLAQPGNHIWVKDDTYTASSAATMFTIDTKPGISVMGGFAGTETYIFERPSGTYTVLDGANTSANVLNVTGSSSVRLDGLHITRGVTAGTGAGLNIDSCGSGTITVANSLFDHHSAVAAAAIRSDGCSLRIGSSTIELNASSNIGGAAWITNAPSVEISDSTIRQNSGSEGGAFKIDTNSVAFSSRNSVYESNTATLTGGGALFLNNMGSVSFDGDTFTGNAVPNSNGGAVWVHSNANPGTVVTITGSRFENNSASAAGVRGGAVYMQHSTAVSGMDVTVRDSEFVNNFTGNGGALATLDSGGARVSTIRIEDTLFEANRGLSGSALFVDRAISLTIDSTKVIGNRSTVASGIRAGGAAFLRNMTNLTIADSLFWKNSLQKTGTNRGGALWIEGAAAGMTTDIVSSAFRENMTPLGRGGAIGLNAGAGTLTVNVVNSSFDGNYSSDTGGAIDINNLVASGTTALNVWNSAFYRNLSGNSATLMDVNRTPSTGTGNGAVNNSCGLQDFGATMNVASLGNVILDGTAANLGDPFHRMATGELFLKSASTGDAYTSACADAGDVAQATSAFTAAGLGNWFDYTTLLDDPSLGGPYLDDAGDVDAGVHYVPQDGLNYLPLRTPSLTASSAVLAAGSEVTLSVEAVGVITGCDVYEVSTETYAGSIPGGAGTVSATLNLAPGLYRADCSELSDHTGSSYVIVREAVVANPSNTGTENGKTWATGYNTAPEAATAALPLWTDIWLKEGTYRATVGGAAFVTLPAQVGLYGGFTGSESSFPSTRLAPDRTVLSGDVNNSGVPDAGDAGPVILMNTGSVLDGVTGSIGRSASGSIVTTNPHQEIVIRNAVIEKGISTTPSSGTAAGGLYAASWPGQITRVENVRFTGNQSLTISTDYATGNHLPRAELHLDRVLVDGNTAIIRAIGLFRYTSTFVSNSAFLNNTNYQNDGSAASAPIFFSGISGTAVHVWDNVTIAGNVGQGNVITSGTGAIGIGNNVSVTLRNATIANNAGNSGSTIYSFFNTPLFVQNTVFYGNYSIGGATARPDIDGVVNSLELDSVCSPQDFAGTLAGVTITTAGPLLDNSTPAFGDPFTEGPSGELFLRHAGVAGSAYTSACVDAGNDGLVPFTFTSQTTRADGTFDSGTSDLGRHYDPSEYAWIGDLRLVNLATAVAWNVYGDVTSCDILDANGTVQHTVSGSALSAGNWTFPAGSDNWTLSCTDSVGRDFSATIDGENQPPVAGLDSFADTENSGVDITIPIATLLTNDSDVDTYDAVEFADGVSGVSAYGVAVTVAGTDIIYDRTPEPFEDLSDGETLVDSFTYAIRDSNGAVSTGTVEITITGANDAPALAGGVLMDCADGDSFTLTPALTDTDTGDLWAYSDITVANACSSVYLGNWFSVDGGTGEITGTCPALGVTCDIEVEVDDGVMTASTVYTIGENSRFVTVTGGGAADGSGWANAYGAGNLQTAVDDAEAMPYGQVLIAEGSYLATAVNIPVITANGPVKIYGGFAGATPSEQSVLERPDRVDATLTVLNGDFDSSGTGNAGDSDEVIRFETGGSGLIDGLTVANGYDDDILNGAGIHLDIGGAGLELSNLDIRNNTAAGISGGGIGMTSGNLTVRNSRIRNNYSGSTGGGIAAQTGGGNTLRVETTSFTANASGARGGGIFASSTPFTLVNVTFDGNGAVTEGAAIAVTGGGKVVDHGTFRNNISGGAAAGAIHADLAGVITIRNSAFYGNERAGGISSDAGGAGLFGISYACNGTGLPGTGNVLLDGSTPAKGDPFRSGVAGQVFLKRTDDGDAYTSACVDAGSETLSDTAFTGLDFTRSEATTSFYGDPEGFSPTDIGAHYREPRRWYVHPSGSDLNDGLSWLTARATIQSVIDSAGPGDHIWAGDGPGTLGTGAFTRFADLRSDLVLLGGFDGTETSALDRVDGELTELAGETDGAILGDTVSDVFIERFDLNGNSSAGDGGAVSLIDSTGIDISASHFESNSATNRGGAVYLDFGSDISVRDSVFTGNGAAGGGGGLYLNNTDDVMVGSSTFENSDPATLLGGAIATIGSDNVQILDSGFLGNETTDAGGAIYSDFSTAFTVDGSLFRNNVTGAFGGGAYYASVSDVMITDSIFDGNEAGSQGGGAICSDNNGIQIDLANVTFTDNRTSGSGGAIGCVYGNAEIYNSSFGYNIADSELDGTGAGGAVSGTVTSTVDIYNSVFYGNRGSSAAGTGVGDDFDDLIAVTTEDTCLYEPGDTDNGNTIVLDQAGATLGDPFRRGLGGELFLKQVSQGDAYTSACVDAGDDTDADTAVATYGLTDWRDQTTGLASEVDTGTVDMGAHYDPAARWYVGNSCTGTCNGVSWNNRSNSLAAVLAEAGDGDHVWLAEGTYIRESGVAADPVISRSTGSVYLFGGFAGTETAFADRYLPSYRGTISGQGTSNSVISLTGDARLYLDGLTVTGGSGGTNGGGLRLSGNSIGYTRSMEFRENTSMNGGHIAAFAGTTLLVDSTLLEDGTAVFEGGALFCDGCDVRIERSRIVNNSAGVGDGGGIHLENFTATARTFELMDTEIAGNSTAVGTGGGLYVFEYNVMIQNSTFQENSATSGGGLYVTGLQPVLMYSTIFQANDAAGGNGGGALLTTTGDVEVINGIWVDNQATGNGSGLYLDGVGTHRITNTSFSLNSAGVAGALFGTGAGAKSLYNSVFFGNSAGGNPDVQGAFTIDSACAVQNLAVTHAAAPFNLLDGGIPEDGDPFVEAASGHLFLSQIAAGQSFDSDCVDFGDDTDADNTAYGFPSVPFGSDWRDLITRSDLGTADATPVDLGYHLNPLHPVIYSFTNPSGLQLAWSTTGVEDACTLSGDGLSVDLDFQPGGNAVTVPAPGDYELVCTGPVGPPASASVTIP